MTATRRLAVAAVLGFAAVVIAGPAVAATGPASVVPAAAPTPSSDSVELGVVVKPRTGPTPSVPPSHPTPPPHPTPSHHPAGGFHHGPLPRTGAAVAAIALGGLVLVGGGVGLRVLARRRATRP